MVDPLQIARHTGLCVAIGDYMEREEKRKAFVQEAMASWQAYKETGQHLTLDETQAWLDTWRTDKETEAPDWHE